MAEIKSVRRYYLHKRRLADECEDEAIAGVFQAKQEAEPGTALDATFPFASKLSPLGYTTREDLDGADVDELRNAGLSAREAVAVITALAALLATTATPEPEPDPEHGDPGALDFSDGVNSALLTLL